MKERHGVHFFLFATAIFDVGSNTGFYALWSRAYSKNLKVLAFEPNEANIQRLNKNLLLNSFNDITVEKKAVGSSSGTTKFYVQSNDQISDVSSTSIDFTTFSRCIYQRG